MKIAVCGSGQVLDEKIAEKAKEIGKEIALSGNELLTGGCHGYPYEAAKAAFENMGKVTAYSPASDIKKHKERYNFPDDVFSSIVFTGKGIPARNLELVQNADAVILIDGKIGTLNEFTIAFHLGKKIGVLLESGGISDMIKEIAEKTDKHNLKDKIVYEKDGKRLVKLVLDYSIIFFKA